MIFNIDARIKYVNLSVAILYSTLKIIHFLEYIYIIFIIHSDPEEETVLHSGGQLLPRGEEELSLLQIQQMSQVKIFLKQIY